jgi:hypothetical protein
MINNTSNTARYLGGPLLGFGFDVVAPLTIGLLLEARLDALGQSSRTRLLDLPDRGLTFSVAIGGIADMAGPAAGSTRSRVDPQPTWAAKDFFFRFAAARIVL